MNRKNILILTSLIAICGIFAFSKCTNQDNSEKTEITFFVVADTHFDPPPESDQYYHTVAINAVCGTINNKEASVWPEKIDGQDTFFESRGKKIAIPAGVIMAGDITDRADPRALDLLKTRYQMGEGDKVINFPVFVGLGNHDLDPQHVGENADAYRQNMLAYVAERHQGPDAPVPVTNFDSATYNYSWDWQNVHFIQTHRFAGNTENGHINSLNWLRDDLKKYASDGKPVVIIQHYGFDSWSGEWWNDNKKNDLLTTIKEYNIIGIFVGHNHVAENFKWNGIDIFQVNNAWPDSDGSGSFLICKITDQNMDAVTCRWKDGDGNVELVAPFYHKKLTE